jgi:hypothetical protein
MCDASIPDSKMMLYKNLRDTRGPVATAIECIDATARFDRVDTIAACSDLSGDSHKGLSARRSKSRTGNPEWSPGLVQLWVRPPLPMRFHPTAPVSLLVTQD